MVSSQIECRRFGIAAPLQQPKTDFRGSNPLASTKKLSKSILYKTDRYRRYRHPSGADAGTGPDAKSSGKQRTLCRRPLMDRCAGDAVDIPEGMIELRQVA